MLSSVSLSQVTAKYYDTLTISNILCNLILPLVIAGDLKGKCSNVVSFALRNYDEVVKLFHIVKFIQIESVPQKCVPIKCAQYSL